MSINLHQIEASGLLHAPASLSPENEVTIPGV
jgi:hypothetical protein